MPSEDRLKIVILGAGFAGVEAARRLARLFPDERTAQITLCDQNNFLLFTPMLIEVLGGQVDMLHIVSPIRQLNRRIDFVQGRVRSIDLAAREVELAIGGTGLGDPSSTRVLKADHIVIALGSVPNYYGIPGLQENCLTMKTLCDAVGIRNRTLALLERANAEPDPRARRHLLTFLVGGGGFSGVETAAGLHDLVHYATSYYPNVSVEDHKIILVEAAGSLLPELGTEVADYALKKLRSYDIEVLLNTQISEVGRDYVRIASGDKIDVNTVVWTGGVSPVSVVTKQPCNCGGHGGIVTDATCAVPDYPGIWAVGDCAEIPQPGSKGPYPPTAQNAVREGKLVADNIYCSYKGRNPKPFIFKSWGELAVLGKKTGVANIRGVCISGFAAWFLWRTVYLAKLPRPAQRVRVALDWTLDLIFGRDIVRMPADCVVAGSCGGSRVCPCSRQEVQE